MAIGLTPGTALAKPSGHDATIVIDKLAFGPIPPNLRVGDVVVWSNRDVFRHTATAPRHFDIDLPPGATRRMRLGRAGRFAFLCKYHPGMKGVLTVVR